MKIVTKRLVLAAVAGAIALGITAGVRASMQDANQDPRPFHGPRVGPGGRGGPGGPMAFGPDGPLGILRMLGARLNLTDAQKEQIKNIAESHREEWKALGDRARPAHEALNDAITADAIDEGLVRSKSAEVAVVQTDIAVATARVRAEAWQVLTPEQRAQAKQMQAEMKNRRKGR